MSINGSPRLTSWKEIAAYLGRDVRTVLRWHKHRGLPVHRVPGGRRGGVFAYTDELEQWLGRDRPALTADESEDESESGARRPPGRRLLYVTLGSVAAASLLILAVAVPRLSPQPVTAIAIAGSRLVAYDLRAREVWSYPLPPGAALLSGSHRYVMADLDGDATSEIVVPVRMPDPASGRGSDVILCLEQNGRLRWKIELGDRLTFRTGEFSPPWRIRDLALVRTPAGPRIAVVAHHDVWWPSFIATFDGNGRSHDRFVNAGWLVSLAATPDGRHLVASGVNNARGTAAVVVLDSDALTGRSPEAQDSPFYCESCAAGAPARYLTLARTEISVAVGRMPFDSSVSLQPDGGWLVRVSQDPANSGVEALYHLSPAFVLARAGVSDIYWDVHRRLEQEGRLGHRAEACPERQGLPVHSWTNGAWKDVAAPLLPIPGS